MNLKDYTEKYTQIALAKSIEAAPSFVNQWVNGGRRVPAAYCVAIERTTGGEVTRQELRPDDYWLIWPDLKAPTAQAATEVVAVESSGYDGIGSSSVLVRLSRGLGGEPQATFAIECEPAIRAPAVEHSGPDDHTVRKNALALEVLLQALGDSLPFDVGAVHALTVVHEHLDIGVILAPKPWHSGNPFWQPCADGRVIFHA